MKRKKDTASEHLVFLPVLYRQYRRIRTKFCSPRALDSLQVLRKYIRERPETLDEIFSALNVIENFTDR